MEARLEEDKRRGRIVGAKRRPGPVAPENSVRIKAFYWLLPSLSALARRRRMEDLMRMLEIKPGTRVLDLGGGRMCQYPWTSRS